MMANKKIENIGTTCEKDLIDSFKMLGVMLETRLGRKVAVRFPGMDGLPTWPEMLLDEPVEDEWPESETHLFITHGDELQGASDSQTVPEICRETRLVEAVVELPSVCLPPAMTSLSPKGEPDMHPGAVIWMLSAETEEEFLKRKTLIASVGERTCPGIRKGLEGGPTGEGFRHVKDLLMELLVGKRVVEGVSRLVDVEDTAGDLTYRR